MGLGERHDPLPVHELAGERRLLGRPHLPQRCDVLVGPLPTAIERDPQRIELLLQPPHPDTELDTALRQRVERRDLLGQHRRVALRKDQHPRAEPHLRRVRRHPRQPDERVGNGRVLRARHLAGRAVGVLRLVAPRDQHVLDRPHRLDAVGITRLGQRDRALRSSEGSGIGEDDPVAHPATLLRQPRPPPGKRRPPGSNSARTARLYEPCRSNAAAPAPRSDRS